MSISNDEEEFVGTTHANHGEGNPKLVAVSDLGPHLGERMEFPLDKDLVCVGSGQGQDFRLDGLASEHFEVSHDERDEYRVRAISEIGGGSVSEPQPRSLHTGATITAGGWIFTFHRDERADHGRPHGGRSGGEGSKNLTQSPRPADLAAGEIAPDVEVTRDD